MRDLIKTLKKANAIITDGHFVGTSGRHFNTYINKDVLFSDTETVSKVGKLFANKFKNKKIDVVVAPALGGIILGQWTAYHLSRLKKKKVLSVYTEKDDDGGQVFKRGYGKFIQGKNVLVLEDLITTGGSVKKVLDTVKKSGGKVVEICVMVSRNPDLMNKKTFGAPFSALAVYEVKSYNKKKCPLCKTGIPIDTILGHGKEYLKSKNPLR